GEQLPVTSQMRRVKAIWNILSDAGRRVAVVGWWATWPAETVRGTIVSDHVCYHFLLSDGAAEEGRAPGITFPAEAQAELAPLIRRPGDVTLEEAARFVHVGAEDFARPFAFSDDLSQFRWALATAESYRRIGLHLWERERPVPSARRHRLPLREPREAPRPPRSAEAARRDADAARARRPRTRAGHARPGVDGRARRERGAAVGRQLRDGTVPRG